MTKADTIREWALDKVGCPYIFAAAGQECTPAFREMQMKNKPAYAVNIKKYCPVLSGKKASCDGCQYKGKPSYDCSGLSMEAAKLVFIQLLHGASSQWKDDDAWDVKGPISEMPRDKVCFVYNEMETANPMGHVGIYLGDGTVVDARGHAYGVMHTMLESYPWDHYGILKNMQNEEVITLINLLIGNRGEAVKTLQTRLNANGFDCGAVDGIFGPKTEAAVKKLQTACSLPETGIVDDATYNALNSFQSAPVPDPDAKAKALAQQVYNQIKDYL